VRLLESSLSRALVMPASNHFLLTATVDAGSVKHTLLFGSEIGHDTYENQAY
jgi:hypothetical protein